jgi:hypothetical protein
MTGLIGRLSALGCGRPNSKTVERAKSTLWLDLGIAYVLV